MRDPIRPSGTEHVGHFAYYFAISPRFHRGAGFLRRGVSEWSPMESQIFRCRSRAAGPLWLLMRLPFIKK